MEDLKKRCNNSFTKKIEYVFSTEGARLEQYKDIRDGDNLIVLEVGDEFCKNEEQFPDCSKKESRSATEKFATKEAVKKNIAAAMSKMRASTRNDLKSATETLSKNISDMEKSLKKDLNRMAILKGYSVIGEVANKMVNIQEGGKPKHNEKQEGQQKSSDCRKDETPRLNQVKIDGYESISWEEIEFLKSCDVEICLYPEVVPKHDHTVLVETTIAPGEISNCFPKICHKLDLWDENHLKLPYSDNNRDEGESNKWSLITKAFTSVILSSQQLEATILSYNKKYAEKWNFSALHSFFDKICDKKESTEFFQSLLPKMTNLALCLPELVTGGIPLLKHGCTHSITLSQMQIASLLANAFFVTFPHRNSNVEGHKYANYPSVTFTQLFHGEFETGNKGAIEKIKGILHYFRRVTATPPTGIVTYTRHFLPESHKPNWAKSKKMFPVLNICSFGTIEDEGFAYVQLDFSHKLMERGLVTNECMLDRSKHVMFPELILSKLLAESLNSNEALIINGCERFSRCKGYGEAFEWDGNFVDNTRLDKYGRKCCTIIIIDVLCFENDFAKEQYSSSNVHRELNKAYAGFFWGSNREKKQVVDIATGNWSCSVYKSDPEFVLILQLMAAAESNRNVVCFTFGNEVLENSMKELHQLLIENQVTVGYMYDILHKYYNSKEVRNSVPLSQYVRKKVMSNSNSTKVPENFQQRKLTSLSAVDESWKST